jgi:hypothetical protein
MLSDIISANSNAAINPEQHESRIDTQQIVHVNGSQYRVLSREFANKSSLVSFWCVFWMTTNLVITANLVFYPQNFNVFYVLLRVKQSSILFYSQESSWDVSAYTKERFFTK